MEHILQFAINIDDETIKQRVEQSATDKMAAEVTKSVKNAIFTNQYWGGSGFTTAVEKIIREVLTDYKDVIIDQAVKMVADSIKRSKAYKTAVADMVEDLGLEK